MSRPTTNNSRAQFKRNNCDLSKSLSSEIRHANEKHVMTLKGVKNRLGNGKMQLNSSTHHRKKNKIHLRVCAVKGWLIANA